MTFRIYPFILFTSFYLLAPQVSRSDNALKVERHEDKVIYQIESDKGDQKKDKGEISSIVKSLEVIIDNGRGTHGKRKTDNCR